MRKLVYECTKNGSVVKVTTMAQADELKLGGWKVEEVFETIPTEIRLTAKQAALRIKV